MAEEEVEEVEEVLPKNEAREETEMISDTSFSDSATVEGHQL